MHVGGDSFSGADNEGKIGVTGVAQRGGHADSHRVHLLEHGVIGRPSQSAISDQFFDHIRGHVQDIALAAVEHVHLFFDRIDTDHVKARGRKNGGKWQPNVTHSQYRDAGGFVVKLLDQLL